MSGMRFAGEYHPSGDQLSCTLLRLSDIAVNLTDPMYQGQYHGKSRHPSDVEAVVERARQHGVERILITGTSLSESREALSMAQRFGMLRIAACEADLKTCTAPLDAIRPLQPRWKSLTGVLKPMSGN